MGTRISGEEVLALATGLPETGIREYDHAVAVTLRDHAIVYVGHDGEAAMVKCLRDEAAALVGTEPEVFSPGHVRGRFGWVRVRLDAVVPEVMRELVVEAWRASAPKRLLAELDGDGG